MQYLGPLLILAGVATFAAPYLWSLAKRQIGPPKVGNLPAAKPNRLELIQAALLVSDALATSDVYSPAARYMTTKIVPILTNWEP